MLTLVHNLHVWKDRTFIRLSAYPKQYSWVSNVRVEYGETGEDKPARFTQGGPRASEYVINGQFYWYYKEKIYRTKTDNLTPEDVIALVNEAENKVRLRLAKAHALQAMTQEMSPKSRRKSIPQDIKTVVWQRDGGRCVECDSKELLEFDHIIPVAMGGANTARNIQLLCETCNRRKGATLG